MTAVVDTAFKKVVDTFPLRLKDLGIRFTKQSQVYNFTFIDLLDGHILQYRKVSKAKNYELVPYETTELGNCFIQYKMNFSYLRRKPQSRGS